VLSRLTSEEDVEVTALAKRGWTISAIARHVGRDRRAGSGPAAPGGSRWVRAVRGLRARTVRGGPASVGHDPVRRAGRVGLRPQLPDRPPPDASRGKSTTPAHPSTPPKREPPFYLVASGGGSDPGSNRASEGQLYGARMAGQARSEVSTRPASLIARAGLLLAEIPDPWPSVVAVSLRSCRAAWSAYSESSLWPDPSLGRRTAPTR
jgi:hypothetical protein